ncbi:hypothetical protein AB1Y20_019774 [Prymnesium parvum]|uniref:ATP synthase mitochondrial F1 complex assembly factor 1 n=1 Tax=Prymnesium parvum TaxID=97485 RepID=A0AB34JSR7_PRYPA
MLAIRTMGTTCAPLRAARAMATAVTRSGGIVPSALASRLPRPSSSRASHAQRRCMSGFLAVPGVRRSLDEVAKLDMLNEEDPSRIGAIWESFHESRDAVAGASLELGDFDRMRTRGAESPMFVFPIRRNEGHFMLFSQFSPADQMFVLTYLEEYQRNPLTAQPWASIILFDELVATKGVPLMRAEVAQDRLTKKEAEHLLLLYQRYYAKESTGYDKVWMFNHANRHFDLGSYLASCP